MRRKSFKASFIGLVAATVTASLGSCARERTVSHKDVDSVIYAGGSYYRDWQDIHSLVHFIYLFDAESVQLEDSLALDVWPQRLASSSDGSVLFLECYSDSSSSLYVRAVESSTGLTLWDHHDVTLSAVLEGGRTVAVVTLDHETKVVDWKLGETIIAFSDTIKFFHGEHADAEMIGVISSASDRTLKAIDSRSGEARGGYRPRLVNGDLLDIRAALLHPDGKLALGIGRRAQNSDSWFVVGDINADSTLLQHRLVYPYGEIAVSGDGRLVAVTDPSSPFHDSYATLDLFDILKMAHVHRFIEPEIDSPGQIRFVYEKNDLLSFPLKGRGPLQRIDLTTMIITATRWLPTGDTARTSGFMCGSFDVAIKP